MEDFPTMVGGAKWGKIIVDYICFKMIKTELPGPLWVCSNSDKQMDINLRNPGIRSIFSGHDSGFT